MGRSLKWVREIPVDKSVYSYRLWVYHEKHGVLHHLFDRRCPHEGHRRAPASARHQAGRAEAGRSFRRLAHAGAPGAVPAVAEQAHTARARTRRLRGRTGRRRGQAGVRRAPHARSRDDARVRAHRHARQDQGAEGARCARKVSRGRAKTSRAAPSCSATSTCAWPSSWATRCWRRSWAN